MMPTELPTASVDCSESLASGPSGSKDSDMSVTSAVDSATEAAPPDVIVSKQDVEDGGDVAPLEPFSLEERNERLGRGVNAIRVVVRTLPPSPGVYRMLDAKGDALYVGKARNLRNRVGNYTNPQQLSNRLRRMVADTVSMEVVVTHTEVEALLLESNLIKKLMPRFNILLRDDKSFAEIEVTHNHAFPRLRKHRGAHVAGNEYFGPFASAGSVERTITALQRAFLIRPCADTVFATRTRPCLQFQIKRCSAPCVDRIDADAYREMVEEARAFLSGRNREIQERLAREMAAAADALDFETAARLRDRVRALAAMHADQTINVEGVVDADAIAAHQAGGHTCIQAFFLRGGQNRGSRAYFPSHDRQLSAEEVLAAFLGQFYDDKPAPKLILLSHNVAEPGLIEEALSLRAGHRVHLQRPERGDKRRLVDHALTNAREALARRMSETESHARLLEGVARIFGLDEPPERIEIYDNSHIQGTNAVGGMVVAGPDGFRKTAYRKFNMRGTELTDPLAAVPPVATPEDSAPLPTTATVQSSGGIVPITPGDDYAMMREMLTRRFGRAVREDPERTGENWPNLVLIDGGAGQLSVALATLADLGLHDLCVAAIAKGPDRNAGRERFFMAGKPPFSMEARDPVLYYLQRLRDEAHRFAIGTHRARRQKAIGRSPLDDVPGIGARRKKALLMHFGSARSIARAGLTDLEQVEGISRAIAQKIYDHFHTEG